MYGIEVTGLQELQRELGILAGGLNDLHGLWERLSHRFRAWVGDQFASQGGWGGIHWVPLNPRYAAWKASHSPGRSILIASGDLEQAAEDPQEQASPHSLTLSIDSPIYRFHQRGTSKMPARPLIPGTLPVSAELEVEEEAVAYVRERVSRGGLLHA